MWGNYVGLPWLRLGRSRAGLDCWGLNRLILGEQRGIWLPLYDTVNPADRACVGAAVAEGRGDWLPVSEADMGDFDFVLMRSDFKALGRRIAADVHFGIAAPGRNILHVQEGGTSVLQPFDTLRHRVVEILRHKELA